MLMIRGLILHVCGAREHRLQVIAVLVTLIIHRVELVV